MTAPAAIRQADLKRVVDIAKASGCVIELEKDGMKIRVFPDNPDIHREPEPTTREVIPL
jgi:hypothetical protein